MGACSKLIEVLMKKLVAVSLVAIVVTLLALSTIARQGGRGPGIEPLAIDDHTGYQSIFDSKTLNGWDGDPQVWRVEDGVIIGESTAEKPIKVNTFLIWRVGQPKDFDLKVDYRINSTNSGIQYRSVELPDVGKWVLKGYQADIDFQNQYTGQLYEERGRGFLAMRGQVTELQTGKKRVIANLRSAMSSRVSSR